ncbi:MAG: cupin domain-containing protein [Planctomycetota bacterium]|jgi:mannose-6-phosphate isomerase-like protein (cupin superfamily)
MEDDPRDGQETRTSVRPWGDIHMVVRNQRCSVDLTTVKPGGRSSLHSHATRYELFHVLDAGGVLELNGEVIRPEPHDEFLVRPGDRHRFWAEGGAFRMLVVCFGEWSAADQERHEDDYGRRGEPLELEDE